MDIRTFKKEDIECGQKLFTFVNPYSYSLLNKKGNEYLSNFYIYADGISYVKIHNFFHNDKINRYSFDFTSLAPIIFEYATKNKLKVALIGGTDYEIEQAKTVILRRFNGLDIVFSSHGYIQGKTNVIIEQLNDADVDIIIAGLGTPFQEDFIYECNKKIESLKFAFTCGGFLSQISTNENYFHPVFDKLHIRWLQRFYRHSYVRKRMIIDYPHFYLSYIKEHICYVKK